MSIYIPPNHVRGKTLDVRRKTKDTTSYPLHLMFYIFIVIFLTSHLSPLTLSWAEEKRVVNEEMGIMVATITEEYRQDLNLENSNGVIVLGVLPGGPADEGGIHPGDVILGISGLAINNIEEYEKALEKLKGRMDFNIMVRNRDGLFSFIQIINRE